MSWIKNITDLPDGIFRTINGNADELIAIGRITKAGFPCSRVDITNSKHDAIIDLGNGRLLRVQIKGTSTGSVDFTGGGRSGQQISREAESRVYKYTEEDCEIFVAIDSDNGDLYIIPIDHLTRWGNTKALSRLQYYKENWDILKTIASV